VHGVATHLADHSLPQFVNNVTNRPVVFQYEAFGFEGKQVGIICTEQQVRPIYLKRDFGKLSREEVYVRRGSSTDPTKPAKPKEMGLKTPIYLGAPIAHACTRAAKTCVSSATPQSCLRPDGKQPDRGGGSGVGTIAATLAC
jgi:hypothetical protein